MLMIIFCIILKLSLGDKNFSEKYGYQLILQRWLLMGPTSFFRITGDILCLCRLGDIAILFSCLETANREFIKKNPQN